MTREKWRLWRWWAKSVAPHALAAWKIRRWGAYCTVNWCFGIPAFLVYCECGGDWGALLCLGVIGVNVHGGFSE